MRRDIIKNFFGFYHCGVGGQSLGCGDGAQGDKHASIDGPRAVEEGTGDLLDE